MRRARDLLDPIRLLEALYDLERPRNIWFRGVLDAAGAVLDTGAGVGMLLYDVSGSVPRIDALAGVNIDPNNVNIGNASHGRADWAADIVRCYRNVICGTLDEHVPNVEMRAALRDIYKPIGVRDQVLVNGANRSGIGCALYIFSTVLLRLTVRQRTVLMRIASHLSTAYRLQRRLERTPAVPNATIDAVLTVDGQVKHAEKVASSTESRRRLAESVKGREWARTRAGRRDGERATGAWKPLVGGHWSLVDCYERGGKRYVTARENVPAPTGLETLSARERQVASLAELGRPNKVIAYELGLVDSTVRVLLARAASKLGVRTRSELIAQVRSRQHR